MRTPDNPLILESTPEHTVMACANCRARLVLPPGMVRSKLCEICYLPRINKEARGMRTVTGGDLYNGCLDNGLRCPEDG